MKPGPGLDELSRRAFFKLAGLGGLGAAACSSRPAREILPYVNQPPELVPGVAVRFATGLVEDGFATGVTVETHEGRPTKLEGNPDHPASLGATRARDQAAVLGLYDPQRAQLVTERSVPAPWSAITAVFDAIAARQGKQTHLVLEPTTSPFVIELLQRVRARWPGIAMSFWSPFEPRFSLEGNRRAFGRPLQTQLALRDAEVIVALDADLVADHPMALAYARELADHRRVVDAHSTMSRLYAIEATTTPTGIIADHRFAVRPSEIPRIAADLMAAIQGGGRAGWVAAIARDLRRVKTHAVVVAGERQPPIVHATVATINAALGSRCVGYSEPVAFEAGTPSHDLIGLARAIDRDQVRTLLVLGGNPAYTAPAELGLAAALRRVETSVYLGLYEHETALACRYVIPGLHDLEQWGAARAYDGTITPIQPMIERLFDGHSVEDVLRAMLGDPAATAHERVREAWPRLIDAELEPAFARGAIAGTAAKLVAVEPARTPIEVASPPPRSLDLEIRPHPFVYDGRYSNNPWLLELPEPITKLTWDNAVLVSPRTATQLGIETGRVVTLVVAGRMLDVPALVVPGHADDALALYTGFGRTGGERVAAGIGANAFHLVTGATGWQPAVDVVVHDDSHELAITQEYWGQHDRPVVMAGTLAKLDELGHELARFRDPPPTLIASFPATGAQWAMSIDLTTCTGCTACVMACAAENNTPIVGKSNVLNKREMFWLRIDRYIDDGGTIEMQPMTCQHCERAPCEYVCPTEATAHSPDGLNEMAYNRCIGTRFCSNNCPYKVRRFNWFDFKEHHGLRILGKNPDVTVRDRGVMEKCTYCVQRIRREEIDARIADRPIGQVTTACQQACPTQAIAFGSITDPSSAVTEQRGRPHNYAVLHDQGTVPRTRYLARIRNPNPELA